MTGADARVALEIALAARESVETAAPVVLNGGAAVSGFQLAVSVRRWSSRTCRSSIECGASTSMGFAVEIWSWHDKDLKALADTGARFSSMTGLPARRPDRSASADEVVRTAELSIKAAETLGVPRLNLHTAELVDGKAARPATAPPARCGRRRCARWSASANSARRPA